MEIVQSKPRPHKLILTKEEAKFVRSMYNLIIELESATNYTVSKEDIFEDIINECIAHRKEENVSIELDDYYEGC